MRDKFECACVCHTRQDFLSKFVVFSSKRMELLALRHDTKPSTLVKRKFVSEAFNVFIFHALKTHNSIEHTLDHNNVVQIHREIKSPTNAMLLSLLLSFLACR